ncbi:MULTISPECIES: copper chaperone CopZ [unclassified Sporosarcina]|uniref:copper chaperone CopZ n=1 Tax=unclassified Sporosarcina TaxID=2647733 RepID=UPI00204137CA|nr:MULTISPECIES: copper chaperone CopZ [unclassified Sporosarcina]GKV66480.1 copper chaperone CopZ [Sporosarcina sp. NCCP-2331]GLB56757.1 copper chaperone CopZ [Sporosarcina sp. NCCP-2378]
MKEVLKVEGMSCGHCVNSIESSVGELKGVSSVKVDLAGNEVTVEFVNEETLNQIKETIEDQGYEVA